VRRNYDQVRKESLIVKRREVEREQNAAVRRARYPTCRNPSGGVGGSGQGPLHRKTHCTRSTLLLSAGSLTPLTGLLQICHVTQLTARNSRHRIILKAKVDGSGAAEQSQRLFARARLHYGMPQILHHRGGVLKHQKVIVNDKHRKPTAGPRYRYDRLAA